MTDNEEIFLHHLEGKIYRWSAEKNIPKDFSSFSPNVEIPNWHTWVSIEDVKKAVKKYKSIYGQVWYNGNWIWLSSQEALKAGLWDIDWDDINA